MVRTTEQRIENTWFYEKITIQKNIIDVKRYQHLNVHGGGDHTDGEGLFHDENYKRTQRCRRESVRQLAAMNFDRNSKFVTLTFKDTDEFDIRSVKDCDKRFKLFIDRLRRRYPELMYLAVIEFQDKHGRGAVHYHMLCNLPFIKAKKLEEIWKYGYVKINAIDKVDHVGAYISKYMTADMDDERLCGLKAYLYSRNLQKPIQVTSWGSDADEFRSVHEFIESNSPSYAATYESEECGTVTVLQYKL